MRPPCVVVDAEVLDDDAGLCQGPQLLAIEALIPEAAVERFHEPVLLRAGRFDVDRPDFLIRQPLLEFLGDELRAVVGADIFRSAVLLDGFLDQPDHVPGLERRSARRT